MVLAIQLRVVNLFSVVSVGGSHQVEELFRTRRELVALARGALSTALELVTAEEIAVHHPVACPQVGRVEVSHRLVGRFRVVRKAEAALREVLAGGCRVKPLNGQVHVRGHAVIESHALLKRHRAADVPAQARLIREAVFDIVLELFTKILGFSRLAGNQAVAQRIFGALAVFPTVRHAVDTSHTSVKRAGKRVDNLRTDFRQASVVRVYQLAAFRRASLRHFDRSNQFLADIVTNRRGQGLTAGFVSRQVVDGTADRTGGLAPCGNHSQSSRGGTQRRIGNFVAFVFRIIRISVLVPNGF